MFLEFFYTNTASEKDKNPQHSVIRSPPYKQLVPQPTPDDLKFKIMQCFSFWTGI